jgi:6-phosphogluconate dehydrogenase
MEKEICDCGMIGLGTMGRNLVYNLCDHGFSVAGFDKDEKTLSALEKDKGSYKISGTKTIKEFVESLVKPRIIMLLVPAGPIVDSVIGELKPLISENDIVMDCGNSHFTDTKRRMEDLLKVNIHFMGVGISGGETGARHGPSIMPGGDRKAWDRVALLLESVSAKVNKEPCVAYMGPGSAGHYVKMVHNGIEYALMQLIAETYHLLKDVAGLNNGEMHAVFGNWGQGELNSYLIGITAEIFTQKDPLTPNDLLDMILDTAHQKGTGKWVSQDAMDLQVPLSIIDASVSARDLSALKSQRLSASEQLKGPVDGLIADKKEFITQLEKALYFAMLTAYAQGFSLLNSASVNYKYGLKPDEIAKIWRGGCIIRAALLEDIRIAFAADQELMNLIMNPVIAEKLEKNQDSIRQIVLTGAETGTPIPAFMASLAWYDGYRSSWLPSNLIQAQRDFFGAHTYQRTDREGNFHTDWNQKS